MTSLRTISKALALSVVIFASANTVWVMKAAGSQDVKSEKELEAHTPVVEEDAPKEDASKEEAGNTGDVLDENSLLRTSSSYEELPQGQLQPWRIVRRLQQIQDGIAAGQPFAQEQYAGQLEQASFDIAQLKDDTWEHERNLDALAVFLMIGGNQDLADKALRISSLGLKEKVFLEAALAFTRRDVSRANALMLLIDHNALPYSMSAQFALAKSMTVSSSNLEVAKSYLMEARRLAPGSLIEEASIRRAIRIAGEMKSFDDLYALYRTYLTRFSKSHYFSDFVRNVSFAAVRMPSKREKSVLNMLNEIIDYADEKQKASVAVYVARYAAISGRQELSTWAQSQTVGKLRPNSKLYTRMQLYAAASKIVQVEETAKTMDEALNINPELLDRSDLSILNAVNMLGSRILTSQEEMISEQAARLTVPNKTDKQKIQDIKIQEMVDQEVQENAILSKANMLFSDIEKLMPKGAK